MGRVNEQPRRAVKGLRRVRWYGVGWDSRWVGVFRPPKYGRRPRVPDEEQSEHIEVLSFLALGHRWPWGVPAQDWKN